MSTFNREELRIIFRNHPLPEETVSSLLNQHVYPDARSWKKFLRIGVLSLGCGFMLAGIVMFFAYNWDALHRFVKLGLIELVIVASTVVGVMIRQDSNIKNTILTAAAVLVGVLYAVFGQIYQTGANAYDFFLGWTMIISLWVLVSGFAPLWTIYLILVNTTIFLYADQLAPQWQAVTVFTILFVINTAVLLLFAWLARRSFARVPEWFLGILSLTVVTYATMGISAGIHDSYDSAFLILCSLSFLAYLYALRHAFAIRKTFLISIISFSIIVIICSALLKQSDGYEIFLLTAIFIITAVSVTIHHLIRLNKKWGGSQHA